MVQSDFYSALKLGNSQIITVLEIVFYKHKRKRLQNFVSYLWD